MADREVYDIVGFDPATVTGQFDVSNRIVVINDPGQLGLEANPSRVAVSFFQAFGPVPVANARCTWATGAAQSAYRLLADLPRVIKYSDYGAMVGYDWYFDGDGFPWSLGIWEVVYRVQSFTNKRPQRDIRSNGSTRNGITASGRKENRLFY